MNSPLPFLFKNYCLNRAKDYLAGFLIALLILAVFLGPFAIMGFLFAKAF